LSVVCGVRRSRLSQTTLKPRLSIKGDAMNQNNFNGIRFNLSGLNFWLTLLLVAWVMASLGLGWLVKLGVVLVVLAIALPVIAIVVLQWWLKRNLVTDNCPVCAYEVAGIHGSELRCPNCGEELKISRDGFTRLTPPGTVDVQAVDVIDVSVKQIKDSDMA
jgi:predicted RNA-binding Zn-ribbon protein involved in translation (DUF1610 family)